MKGKGKGPHDKDKEKDRDLKDCPLQFPDLTTVDHTKECSKYTQVLARDHNGHISLEELDQVQADIEILLASVGKRLKLLGIENQVLSTLADKKEGKKNSNGKGSETSSQSSTPSKRKGASNSEDKEKEKQSSKKFKDGDGKASRPSTPTPRTKGKNSQQSKGQPEDGGATGDSTSDTPKVQKNDAVNRFWTSVEPFCAPITADDLRVIEELLKSYAEETEYMKVPPLGIHYTQRWAEDDMMEEQSDGAKISDKDKKRSSEPVNGTTNSDASSLLKKAELKDSDYYMDDSPFGPLTQRLVSALIEDNLMTPIDDCMADTAECGEVPAVSPRAIAKQFNIGNPATLERRIRKELEEQGILEKEEEEEDDPNDEVLAELRKKQQELRAISQQNINILKSLYRQGQEDMERQELKKKLQAADSEVMDAFRKIQSARQKKKSPTKKEKETIIKVLKERDAILKALES